MDNATFNEIVEAKIEELRNTLVNKAKEYAADHDRLHNFAVTAEIRDQNLTQALAGMMVKHTVSVYDMINSGEAYPKAMWDEKTGDHLVYLLLLQATIVEDELVLTPESPVEAVNEEALFGPNADTKNKGYFRRLQNLPKNPYSVGKTDYIHPLTVKNFLGDDQIVYISQEELELWDLRESLQDTTISNFDKLTGILKDREEGIRRYKERNPIRIPHWEDELIARAADYSPGTPDYSGHGFAVQRTNGDWQYIWITEEEYTVLQRTTFPSYTKGNVHKWKFILEGRMANDPYEEASPIQDDLDLQIERTNYFAENAARPDESDEEQEKYLRHQKNYVQTGLKTWLEW